MKLKLAMTSLVFAGTLVANASLPPMANGASTWDNDGTRYTKVGSINIGSGVRTEGWDLDYNYFTDLSASGLNVKFHETARYEIQYRVRFESVNVTNQFPLVNFYLSTGSASTTAQLGTSLMIGNGYNSKAANPFTCALGVFDLNVCNSGNGGADRTYNPWDHSLNDLTSYEDPIGIYTAHKNGDDGNHVSSGMYTYTIIINTVGGSNQDTIQVFAQKDGSSTVYATSAITTGNIDAFSPYDIQEVSFNSMGFMTLGGDYDTAGSNIASVVSGIFTKYSKGAIPQEPTPELPDPPVPEPSAFGLLAGLGAIALAASRRRRK